MTCPFDLSHFRDLLASARSGGYRFRLFDGDPERGDLFLRHDVDLSLAAALELARLEAEEGVEATYFLMTTSDFYNLSSPTGEAALRELRSLGHAVGLHARWPGARLDERFDPVFAWHNPEPDFMAAPVPGAINVMEPRFAANYRSDSNQHWREGCPHEQLADGRFDWLQLLVHPEIWVYPGETMRETMVAMLAAEGTGRLELLTQDRIDLS
jgi:hypothetical protein